MKRNEVIERLKKQTDAVKARGATSLYLFGSTVRGEAKSSSDVDVFVEYAPDRSFSLLDLVGIKLLLEDELGQEVDILTKDGIAPLIKDSVLQEAVRVF